MKPASSATDADIKPQYTFSKPRKIFKFGKANWEEIKKSCSDILDHVIYRSITKVLEIKWHDNSITCMVKHRPSMNKNVKNILKYC